MIAKVIFLDIDGPMIPGKAAFLPNQTFIHSIFDPCATAMLLRIIEASGARIVISSTHGLKGRAHVDYLFEANGLSKDLLHPDWVTPEDPMRRRAPEIRRWLDDHPEVTSYVAIDDEQLSINVIPNSVQCDAYEGFSFRNYLECCLFLDAFTGSTSDMEGKRKEAIRMVQILKHKEVWRTTRYGELNYSRLREVANQYFPLLIHV